MSRNPRAACGLTKTQQLRQAKTTALMKEYEKKHEAALKQADPLGKRKRVIMPEPKRVDFSKPAMTKTMLARVKQAEKFKQELEKKESMITGRQPKRTPAPVGGDARMGREKVTAKGIKSTRTPAASSTRRDAMAGVSHTAGPSTRRNIKVPEQVTTRKTSELARIMNADIIQAEPIGEGPISNVVIPPGMVSDDRTTIVSIPQPDVAATITSQMANRSIQVISETLDEQDAVEAIAVQNRLTDLQQARREFVITAANVGGHTMNVEDATSPDWSGRTALHAIPSYNLSKQIENIPELADDYLRLEHGVQNPSLLRHHIQKSLAEMEAKEIERKMDEEFERMAVVEQFDDLHLDVPFEDELYQDRDISWEEDESGMIIPRPSRVKAYTQPVPKATTFYEYEPFDPEELERFFDIQRYPPCLQCGPPPGREHLHPDLWELDDPWFKLPSGPDKPDLIQFD